MSEFGFNEAWAKEQDNRDELSNFREKFFIPQHQGNDCIYLTGNSLGLQPKSCQSYLQEELDAWKKYGVEGHFDAKKPWFSYHEFLTPKIAKIVGAKEIETVVTHSLTTNLHLLMVSFYRPEGKRFKILCEAKAFPSDAYALESQVKFHGYNPSEALIEVAPRDGEHCIRHEDLIQTIEKHADEIALIMIGGVNYYTGQVFDMKSITVAGHKAGAVVGFDLAHAAGNIPLQLHDWGVDFAAWCSYKYLNSSPGGVSGIFVHERHARNQKLPRFAGWWGYEKEKRFQMEPGFKAIPGAEGWQLSNAPVLGMAAHLASLDIFEEVGMDKLRKKSEKLSNYLEYVIDEVSKESDKVNFEIITPREASKKGAQRSVLTHGSGKELFDFLTENGVIADWREPNVIRMAPVPLYNSFYDIYRFGEILKTGVNNL